MAKSKFDHRPACGMRFFVQGPLSYCPTRPLRGVRLPFLLFYHWHLPASISTQTDTLGASSAYSIHPSGPGPRLQLGWVFYNALDGG